MEGYIGTISLWAPNWSPRNWSSCSGQILSISSNNALYSLIGTIYGGDGRTTFQLPDLRGRAAIGYGDGPVTLPRQPGQAGGVEKVTLSVLELPRHNHLAGAAQTSSGVADLHISDQGGESNSPVSGGSLGVEVGGAAFFYNSHSVPDTKLAGNSIRNVQVGIDVTILNNGSSQPHYNMMPYQSVGYIICVTGLYPSRS